jgi:hypothetical protein
MDRLYILAFCGRGTISLVGRKINGGALLTDLVFNDCHVPWGNIERLGR